MAVVQFVFTVGTVVLGLYMASKVLGIEPGEGRGRGSKGQKWGTGRCVRFYTCPHCHCLHFDTWLGHAGSTLSAFVGAASVVSKAFYVLLAMHRRVQ